MEETLVVSQLTRVAEEAFVLSCNHAASIVSNGKFTEKEKTFFIGPGLGTRDLHFWLLRLFDLHVGCVA